MRKIFYAFIMLLGTLGCTQNDGEIGDLFGMWKMYEIENIDNGSISSNSALYLTFQNSVVGMIYKYGENSTANCFGLYEHNAKALMLNMRQGETSVYKNFEFEPVSVIEENACDYGNENFYYDFSFTIESLSHKRMVLKTENCIYRFRKY